MPAWREDDELTTTCAKRAEETRCGLADPTGRTGDDHHLTLEEWVVRHGLTRSTRG
jgi:hypothetical protein